MAEGLFWIFISFFAVLGLFELFNTIHSLVCREETRCNLLLVPVGDDNDRGVECRIHTAVAQFSELLSAHGTLLVVDMGMGEKNKDICNRLCALYNLQSITPDQLPAKLKSDFERKE